MYQCHLLSDLLPAPTGPNPDNCMDLITNYIIFYTKFQTHSMGLFRTDLCLGLFKKSKSDENSELDMMDLKTTKSYM